MAFSCTMEAGAAAGGVGARVREGAAHNRFEGWDVGARQSRQQSVSNAPNEQCVLRRRRAVGRRRRAVVTGRRLRRLGVLEASGDDQGGLSARSPKS